MMLRSLLHDLPANRMIRCAATTLLLITAPVAADRSVLNYLYEPALPPELQEAGSRMIVDALNSDFDTAIRISQDMISTATGLQQADPTTYGEMLTNHGILFTASGDHEPGLAALIAGMKQLEVRANPFSPGLLNNIMARGLTQVALADLVSAEDTFRHAQHITHRQHGVYNPEQIPIINQITKTHIKRGHLTAADREQRFTLRIAELAHGVDSPAILPVLNNLGHYYAARGNTLPLSKLSESRLQRDLLFNNAVGMYERAIAIIESRSGRTDPSLLAPLRGLANARMLQVTGRKHAEQALHRALAIVEAGPDPVAEDRARALIDIADYYTVVSNKQAPGYYLEAWKLLQDSEEGRLQAARLFSTPTRLYPDEIPVLYLDRKPDAAESGTSLFARLQYAVGKDGRVRHIRVLDKNVPNGQVRGLRTRLGMSRFRPRIIDGEITGTDGMILNQAYALSKEARTPAQAPDAPQEATR